MLTQIEMKVLNWAYSFSCKSATMPFCWEKGSFSLKRNQRVLYNCILWILLFICFVLKSCILFQKTDINHLIINGIFFLANFGNIICHLTVRLYKKELVQLINQILHVNMCWGEYINCKNFLIKVNHILFA